MTAQKLDDSIVNQSRRSLAGEVAIQMLGVCAKTLIDVYRWVQDNIVIHRSRNPAISGSVSASGKLLCDRI